MLSAKVLEWLDQQIGRWTRGADDRLAMGQAEGRADKQSLRMGAG
jgi:hypothetical protein